MDLPAIKQILTNSLKNVLGTTVQVTPFDAAAIYPTNSDLTNLQQPITLAKLELAMHQLANNKASRPDGLPNEFINLYWNYLKGQILAIMCDFYDDKISVTPYNQGNIILVSKIEVPMSPANFIPISVLNLILKFISKVLSNRLRTVLSDLISSNHTAFVHGR